MRPRGEKSGLAVVLKNNPAAQQQLKRSFPQKRRVFQWAARNSRRIRGLNSVEAIGQACSDKLNRRATTTNEPTKHMKIARQAIDQLGHNANRDGLLKYADSLMQSWAEKRLSNNFTKMAAIGPQTERVRKISLPRQQYLLDLAQAHNVTAPKKCSSVRLAIASGSGLRACWIIMNNE